MYVLRRVRILKGEILTCPACKNETMLVTQAGDTQFVGWCEECHCATTCTKDDFNRSRTTGTVTVTSNPSTTFNKII